MRVAQQGVQIYRSRPSRQNGLFLRRARPKGNGICLECRGEIPFVQLRNRPDATLCATCVQERLECLSADAL
jgi:RNA polymerase-binding transcription factor DksA